MELGKIKTNAFTLIELLVVIAIIGILSGLIIVGMSSSVNSARIAKAQIFDNSLRDSIMSNLISEWKFDGSSIADTNPVTNGTTYLQDSWSGGNNLTIGGSPTVYSGSNCIYGSCLRFNGTADYLIVPATSSTMLLTDNVDTIAMWIKVHSGLSWAGLGNGYANMYTASGVNFTGLQWRTNQIGITANADFYSYYVPVSLSFDTWNFIVVTIDRTANNAKVWVDGLYKGIAGPWPAYTPNGNTVRIGYPSQTGNSNDYLNGYIDQIRIYNSVIPTSQIEQQYYIGINKLLENNEITKEEYRLQLSELNNLAKND